MVKTNKETDERRAQKETESYFRRYVSRDFSGAKGARERAELFRAIFQQNLDKIQQQRMGLMYGTGYQQRQLAEQFEAERGAQMSSLEQERAGVLGNIREVSMLPGRYQPKQSELFRRGGMQSMLARQRQSSILQAQKAEQIQFLQKQKANVEGRIGELGAIRNPYRR